MSLPPEGVAGRVKLLERLVALMLLLGVVRAAEIAFGVRFVARSGWTGRVAGAATLGAVSLAFYAGATGQTEEVLGDLKEVAKEAALALVS